MSSSIQKFTDNQMQLGIKQAVDAGLLNGGGYVPIADNGNGLSLRAHVRGHGRYLTISISCGWGNVVQDIVIAETPCNFGGTRKWFLCPDCGRRCGVLYIKKNIACRTCFDLTYACQYEPARGRMRRKLLNIRKVIGAGMELGNPFNLPPRGMSVKHWEALITDYVDLRKKYYRECENSRAWRNNAPKAQHWKLGTPIPKSN